MTGCLYLVATPIGNLKDITLRALEVLKSVDLITAEDTRHSQSLLHFYGITTKMISLHEHNEQQRIAALLAQLQSGKSIALITDAGTPLISDPGFRLVQALHQAHILVTSIPGPCAAINALVVSGISPERFLFEGFLPVKGAERQRRLTKLSQENATIILYEAPHRLIALLTDLCRFCGEKRIATLTRELTKTFETIRQANLKELLSWVESDSNQQKGEIVLVLSGAQKTEELARQDEITRVLKILLAELPLKQAVSLTAQITQAKRNFVYNLALSLSK